MPTDSGEVHCTVPKQYQGLYPSSTVPSTTPHQYEGQYHSSTVPIDSKKTMIMVQHAAQLMTSFRTTTPSTATTGRMTGKQVNPVHVHPETSRKTILEHCMHVHQPTVQVCKPGELLALKKVKHPHNGRTSVNRLPLLKQDILSQYSGYFEGIGHFPGDPYKFHLKPEHKPAWHAPRKVPIHLETAFNPSFAFYIYICIYVWPLRWYFEFVSTNLPSHSFVSKRIEEHHFVQLPPFCSTRSEGKIF